MKKAQETLRQDGITKVAVLHVALELGDSKWKLAFSDGSGFRLVSIDYGNLRQLREAIDKSKKRFGLSGSVQVVSCYEAGRYGFWLHRCLTSHGIKNLVVDSASIEVNRRKRRAKTDRIDAGQLLRMLMRYQGGERKVWAVARVPTVDQEDARQLHRELEVLKKERNRCCNRIQGLLMQQGIRIDKPGRRNFLTTLEVLRTWDGQGLPVELKARLTREYERLEIVAEQIRTLRREQAQRVKKADSPALQKIARLMMLRGLGPRSSWVFVNEFFGWRTFDNGKQVGSSAGLTPTPYNSGKSRYEQGISKAGNRRIRIMSIEIAWGWLRFQPQSKLSRWFNERFAHGGSRMRRIGIVAVARRLLVALWRYLETGAVPEGACLKKEAA
jgi:transposase